MPEGESSQSVHIPSPVWNTWDFVFVSFTEFFCSDLPLKLDLFHNLDPPE